MEKQDKIIKALGFWGFSDIKIIQQVTGGSHDQIRVRKTRHGVI